MQILIYEIRNDPHQFDNDEDQTLSLFHNDEYKCSCSVFQNFTPDLAGKLAKPPRMFAKPLCLIVHIPLVTNIVHTETEKNYSETQ